MEPRAQTLAPIHLVVDSTGLKIFGEGEWLENKHKTKAKRKSWRKLHLGLDLVTGDLVCSDLTTDDVGDPTALPRLLDQFDGDVSRFIAGAAYDGDPSIDIQIVIPPPKNAILSAGAQDTLTLRDQRITAIRTEGRMAWQVSSGYNQRSRGETQMGR